MITLIFSNNHSESGFGYGYEYLRGSNSCLSYGRSHDHQSFYDNGSVIGTNDGYGEGWGTPEPARHGRRP